MLGAEGRDNHDFFGEQEIGVAADGRRNPIRWALFVEVGNEFNRKLMTKKDVDQPIAEGWINLGIIVHENGIFVDEPNQSVGMANGVVGLLPANRPGL